MDKLPKQVVALVIVLIFAAGCSTIPPRGGGCRFDSTEYSTNYRITNPDDVAKALSTNGYNFTEGFNKTHIVEIDFNATNNIGGFIKDKNLRYWQISAYKRFDTNNTRRFDLIDEQGRLYVFINCV